MDSNNIKQRSGLFFDKDDVLAVQESLISK